MAIEKEKVDVVLVGFGWTGAIYGVELTAAGQSVVALERGHMQTTATDAKYPQVIDELNYAVRGRMFQPLAKDTLTIRHKEGDTAVPYREYGSFLLGNNVGGAGLHWNGMFYRYLPNQLRLRSYYEEKYGEDAIPQDMYLQDYPVTYEELEPFFAKFEEVCGVSGQAGNIKGVQQPGGNPFEGWRSTAFPNKPLINSYASELFKKGCEAMGYNPYPAPAANASAPYTNQYGVRLGPCNYCGFCERFACYNYSKASPQTTILPVLLKRPNFELRTNANVIKVNTDSSGKKATGVTYIDAQGNEVFQPAEMVILNAYAIHNVRLLLLSKIGQVYDPKTETGTLGRSYAYQRSVGVKVVMPEGTKLNTFIGTGAGGVTMDDFNEVTFDHTGLGFLGGASIRTTISGGRPILQTPTKAGSPKWGSGWKKATQEGYQRIFSIGISGSVMSYRDAYLDLDPTYTDNHGLPLLRLTFNWHENENKMVNYLMEKMAKVGEAAGGKVEYKPYALDAPYDTRIYQSTHNTGGAIMGDDPKTSVVNKYLQHWDVPNLFVSGASAFPQNVGYNPTALVGALAYHSVHNIVTKYLKNPGPMA